MADHKLTKSIGEHWVCSELARRGWAPALTRDGLSHTDILAVGTTSADRPQIEVQVKTATQKKDAQETNWPLGKLVTDMLLAHSQHEWFVMVTIPTDAAKPLSAFVVPRDHVVAATHLRHEEWRTDPSVPAGRRNGEMKGARVAAWVFEGYRSRWDLLERPTTECPVLLPGRYRELAIGERVGLPAGHPWQQDLPDWAISS